MVRSFDAPAYDPAVPMPGDPALASKATEYNMRYLHWSELEYRTSSQEERKALWNAMKGLREADTIRFRVCGMDLALCVSEPLVSRLDTAISLIPREASKSTVTSEEPVYSSLIEGANVPRDKALALIDRDVEPRDPGERMVWNNMRGLEYALGTADVPLSPQIIKDVQARMTRGTFPEGPGQEGSFRGDGIAVGGTYDESDLLFIPPIAAEVPAMVEDICRFANDPAPIIHPLARAIVIHYLIGYVHPFADGNGRTARALFYRQCIRDGFGGLAGVSVSKAIYRSIPGYSRAYRFAEHDCSDVTYFVLYNLDRIIEALRGYHLRLGGGRSS